MTSHDTTSPAHLNLEELNFVLQAVLADVDCIAGETSRLSQSVNISGSYSTEDLVRHCKELGVAAGAVEALQAARLILHDEDRSTRIKAMASRVRKAQGETDDTAPSGME